MSHRCEKRCNTFRLPQAPSTQVAHANNQISLISETRQTNEAQDDDPPEATRQREAQERPRTEVRLR